MPPAWLSSTAWAPSQFCFAPLSSDFKHSLAFQQFFLLESHLNLTIFSLKWVFPSRHIHQWTSQIAKFSTHSHPTPTSAPKAPGEPTKVGLELPEGSRAAANPAPLQPHGSKTQCRDWPWWQPGMGMQQQHCRRKAGTAGSWERPHRPAGLAGGVSSRSLLPPHSPSAAIWAGVSLALIT